MDRLILEGEAYWSCVTEPNRVFKPYYSIHLAVDPKTLKGFKERGHKIKSLKGVNFTTVKQHKRKAKNGKFITIKQHERDKPTKALQIKRIVNLPNGRTNSAPILFCSDINKVPLKNGMKVNVKCREWSASNRYGDFTGLDLEAVQVV